MRIPVSLPQNSFFDGEDISDVNLTLEQNYNNQIEASIRANHLGSGVLPEALTNYVLFDSNSANGLLDGKPINAQNQPTDSNLGNQLQITLSGSLAAGRRTVKVLIIGLDFEQNLQYDTLTFDSNNTFLTSKHYTVILTILFNDFSGLPSQSFNLGGRIVISQTNPLTLSTDCIMIAQDVAPNLFFRDFFVISGGTLLNVLTAALPSYNINTLNITTGYTQLASIVENDVSSQVGQKFLATTNNIQKITLLMAVKSDVAPFTNLVWTGDLLISIYPLQSTVSCITDIVPQLAIDFDPSNVPLAQLSVDYNSLLGDGIELNTVPQPVDFIFSNTAVGSGLLITPGSYYVVTAKRAGSDDTCQLQFAVGANSSTVTRETLFNGSVWVDVPESSLWFQVWTDAAKVSDGQAYDAGTGVLVPKTEVNSTTGITQDYVLNQIQFVRNDLYSALLQAVTTFSVPVQSEITGNNVNSEQQFTPSVSLLNAPALANIQNVSDPLIIGTITDQNVKLISPGSSTFDASFHEYGFVKNQIVIKVVTDPTDIYRYDQNIIQLVSELVAGDLNGAQIIPNTAKQSVFYRIAKAELITMIYGDVNGDGVVDQSDILAAQQLINSNLNFMPTYSEYITQTTLFTADGYLTWKITNGSMIVASGTDGTLVPNPNNGALANFQSLSANFNSIMNLGSYGLQISNSATNPGNDGYFSIVSLIDNNDLTIQKTYYTSDTILEIMRADIDGNMILNSIDIEYITNYVEAVAPFPATTSPANRVGTIFNAIRLTVEEYVDRYDDYSALTPNRATALHPVPDIFLDGYSSFAGLDIETNPTSDGYGLPFSIIQQLIWDQSNVVVNANPRLVPVAFTYQSGYTDPQCYVPGITDNTYPQPPAFDPGRNDFFIPNNLIVNNGGQILNPDGYFMKMDFEVASVVIEVPPVSFDKEHTINMMTDFIANYSGTGYTLLGYRAMKFADCTFVGINALQLNQVRFNVAVQSFSPQLNGIDGYCIEGIIVDPKLGVAVDPFTGLLTLNFTNLYQDPVLRTLSTKVEITVYLKKAGWNNQPLFINSIKAQNIFAVPTPVFPQIVCPDPTVIIVA
jgi:hypothetical protein